MAGDCGILNIMRLGKLDGRAVRTPASSEGG
jgi:hypothetical protein